MTVCIECSSHVVPETRSKLYCAHCHKKIDKYNEVNNTLKIMDLILLKEPIFRHFLLNSTCGSWNIAALVLLYFGALFSIRLSDLHINTLRIRADRLIEIDFFYTNVWIQLASTLIYIACLRLIFSKMGFRTFLHALLVGSFYSGVKVVFSVWNYNIIQYFIIIDMLSCCENIFALHCLDSDFTKVSSSVLMSRGARQGLRDACYSTNKLFLVYFRSSFGMARCCLPLAISSLGPHTPTLVRRAPTPVFDGVTVSILVCHAEDPSSILGRRVFAFRRAPGASLSRHSRVAIFEGPSAGQ